MTSTPARSADPATQSNYHEIATTHLHLDWTVDWIKKRIHGQVKHTMKAVADSVDEAIFDSSYIDIIRITLADSGKDLTYDLKERHKVMGSQLVIKLPQALSRGDVVGIVIEYSTTDDCTALGWLAAEQTASGKFPFLYSQCQAIHCRSLLPCQDSPSIKLTYSATVHSPLPVLLSALCTSTQREEMETIGEVDMSKERVFKFEQPNAIPSYLIAIVAGELAFASLGERTGVWAEPAVLPKAAWEFKRDTERFVQVAERILSPYSWGRFDMALLPFSFPYGGMENANMTFLTPALIVGDRSQVDVIAHELSHSWHGNLISTEDWQSFWLNESWTTYTERLLARELHGEPTRQFEFIVGKLALDEALQQQAGTPRYQRLHIPYQKGEDPDDGFSTVPYDKGALMLLHIERTVGGVEAFRPYHQDFIKQFSGKSIGTQDWRQHFEQYWAQFPEQAAAIKEHVDLDAWLNGEGLELPVKMEFDTSLADSAYALAKKWDSARDQRKFDEFSNEDIKDWNSNQVCMLLDTLHDYKSFPSAAVDAVGSTYGVSQTSNPEIKLRWLLFALKAGERAQEAADWVQKQGRMKYVRPVYRALNKVDSALARATFERSKSFLHPIARNQVAKDLGL